MTVAMPMRPEIRALAWKLVTESMERRGEVWQHLSPTKLEAIVLALAYDLERDPALVTSLSRSAA
jgi:hypothetical protein